MSRKYDFKRHQSNPSGFAVTFPCGSEMSPYRIMTGVSSQGNSTCCTDRCNRTYFSPTKTIPQMLLTI